MSHIKKKKIWLEDKEQSSENRRYTALKHRERCSPYLELEKCKLKVHQVANSKIQKLTT